MMNRSKVILLVLAVLIVVCLTVVVGGYLFYNGRQRQAFQERPLVLIHQPLNRQRVQLQEASLVHATVRAPGGVSRVDLWVDGAFVATQESPSGEPVSLLVLSAGWQPDTLGPHTLLVHAVSDAGVVGQATVTVEAVAAPPQEAEEPIQYVYVVEQDDTLASIAEDVGVSVEELGALNPDLEPEGPQAGDVLVYRELEVPPAGGQEESAGAGGEAPDEVARLSADEMPPVPYAEPPGVTRVGLFGGQDIAPIDPLHDDTPLFLELEALSLETSAGYEAIHCYAGLGDLDQRWYPDADMDQSTDESFAPLGSGRWDIAAHLAGTRALMALWPGNQALPIAITCVGVVEGGTDAVDLGLLTRDVIPYHWDGISRWATSDEGEDAFRLEYRVSRREEGPRVPYHINSNLARPTNLGLRNYVSQSYWGLTWEYAPNAYDEEIGPITGFGIYLNETLLWTEPAAARESRMPIDWVDPPCLEIGGSDYSFTVSAFHDAPHPEGIESEQSEALVFEPPEECLWNSMIVFHQLITHDLGWDGHTDPADVGPAYGHFYANDERADFGNPEDVRGGRIVARGLLNDHEYSMDAIMHYSDRHASFLVEVPVERLLQVGFEIWDKDRHNADDWLCGGSVSHSPSELSRPVEGVIESANGRCEVTYTVYPWTGGPNPSYAPDGHVPLPQLEVTDLTVDPDTGYLQIHVLNSGYAGWPGQDLQVALLRQPDEIVDEPVWPSFSLPVGRERVLVYEQPLVRPLEVCVALDVGNAVEEWGEVHEGWETRYYCHDRPDLVISNVAYERTEGRLLVTVHNWGMGMLDHRDVTISINDVLHEQHTLTLDFGDSDVLVVTGIDDDVHASMQDGYAVIIDPFDQIAESNEDNNTYVVPPQGRIQVGWGRVAVPHYWSGDTSLGHVNFHFEAHAVSGAESRNVLDWEVACTVPDPAHDDSFAWADGRYQNCHADVDEGDFEIVGEANLEVRVWGESHLSGVSLGSDTLTITPEERLALPVCSGTGVLGSGVPFPLSSRPPDRSFHGNTWVTSVYMCREE